MAPIWQPHFRSLKPWVFGRNRDVHKWPRQLTSLLLSQLTEKPVRVRRSSSISECGGVPSCFLNVFPGRAHLAEEKARRPTVTPDSAAWPSFPPPPSPAAHRSCLLGRLRQWRFFGGDFGQWWEFWKFEWYCVHEKFLKSRVKGYSFTVAIMKPILRFLERLSIAFKQDTHHTTAMNGKCSRVGPILMHAVIL